jgi:hypothetical protein
MESVNETLSSLVFRVPDDGQSPEPHWFWNGYIWNVSTYAQPETANFL